LFHTADVPHSAGDLELAFVVLFVGVDVLPTAVTDGVLVVGLRVGVVVGVVATVDALCVVPGAGGGVVAAVAVVVVVD
jgi:hypothetical protein